MTTADKPVSPEEMSPEASPGGKQRTGVRRVNNMPLYFVGGAVGVFLLIMLLVAADRAEQQNAPAPQAQEKAGNSTMFAQAIVDGDNGRLPMPNDGIIPAVDPLVVPNELPASAAVSAAPATTPTATAIQPLKIERPTDLDTPPPPPSNLQPGRQDELTRIRMAKLQQFEEAVKARSTVQVAAPRSAASANGTVLNQQPSSREDALNRIAALRQEIDAVTSGDPTAAYQARLQQLQQQATGGGIGAGSAGGAPKLINAKMAGGQASGDKYGQFAGNGSGDRWQLDSAPEAPRSPYELRAGFVVPATMISGINSDLPGQIMAQVSQNVYDTATGKWLLVPQGSRLVGAYCSDVAYGQERVLVAWQRIVFPDGKAMDIGAMPGADGAGYAGFKDRVNNHYWRLFSSAVLMSAVTAGVTLSQDQGQSDGDGVSASQAMSQALGQQLGQVTAQLIARNMNIAPTIEIRPGYRFNVIVTKDMTFSKPYEAFDY